MKTLIALFALLTVATAQYWSGVGSWSPAYSSVYGGYGYGGYSSGYDVAWTPSYSYGYAQPSYSWGLSKAAYKPIQPRYIVDYQNGLDYDYLYKKK